ncbi:hypothetical protein B0H11DRAFT_1970139 [Mycena galericulata]|nr:hypothetical protein B0H11DRAFT_1970139 [Mycena galericulata]
MAIPLLGMLAAAFCAIVGAVVAPFAAPAALGLVGFSAIGPVAATFAATAQAGTSRKRLIVAGRAPHSHARKVWLQVGRCQRSVMPFRRGFLELWEGVLCGSRLCSGEGKLLEGNEILMHAPKYEYMKSSMILYVESTYDFIMANIRKSPRPK